MSALVAPICTQLSGKRNSSNTAGYLRVYDNFVEDFVLYFFIWEYGAIDRSMVYRHILFCA
jgi:hypothetical protein